MSEKHITAWSAFMTIYDRKNSWRTGTFDVTVKNREIEVSSEMSNVEGVTASEMANVLGVSSETTRRRFIKFEDAGLIHQISDGDYSKEYKPANEKAEYIFSVLRDM